MRIAPAAIVAAAALAGVAAGLGLYTLVFRRGQVSLRPLKWAAK